MRSVTVAEMRELDRMAIEEFGIPGIVLMENAGRAVSDVIVQLIDKKREQVLVVCGTGNNGGDGFVVARHLWNAGVCVHVLVSGDVAKLSGDALINWNTVNTMKIPYTFVRNMPEGMCAEYDFIVDALFGVGLNADIRGGAADVIRDINGADACVIAVDVPSGLDADTGAVRGCAVKAHTTVTMAVAKKGMLAIVARPYVGKLVVADISIPFQLLSAI